MIARRMLQAAMTVHRLKCWRGAVNVQGVVPGRLGRLCVAPSTGVQVRTGPPKRISSSSRL